MYKVLIVANGHPDESRGGTEIASYLLFDQLQRTDGVEAYFLARTEQRGRARLTTPFSLHRGRPREVLLFTDNNDLFLFSQPSDPVIAQFRSLLERIDPDVIHFHHYLHIGLELIAVARSVNPKVRVFVTLHEYMAICHNDGQMMKTSEPVLCEAASPHECAQCFKDIPASRFLLRELFIKSHFEKVDLFIAPSEFLRQRYIAWGIPNWQIVVLENGIEPVSPPPPRPLAAGETRSAFAFFGQIRPYKGLVQLLLAFEYLNRFPVQRTQGIRLTVHGGSLETNTPQYVEAVKGLMARIPGRVHFSGPYRTRDLGRLMGAVDWVIVPSIWWENSPLVIQEAFAYRRPVICGDIGGMAEKVRRGKDGFHFAVGDSQDLAGLIVRLAGSNATWDRLQGTIRRPTTVAESAARHLDLYRDQSFALAG